jgi:hypothetical protein
MAAHRKLDRRRDDLCGGGLGKSAWNTARSFFDSERPAVLNIRPVNVIFVKENIIELPHVDHFATLLAPVEVLFLYLV